MIPNHLTDRCNHKHERWSYTDGNQLPWILKKDNNKKKEKLLLPGLVHFMHICHLFQLTMNSCVCWSKEIKDFPVWKHLVENKTCGATLIFTNNESNLLKQILFEQALREESWHVYGAGNQQTGLEGPLQLNYQHHHFHHILHWSKLPYQQHDLKAVQGTTISAFWRTIKRCQTRFLLHCFGSGCQRIKHYLKEDSFSREKGPARFTDGEEGAQ